MGLATVYMVQKTYCEQFVEEYFGARIGKNCDQHHREQQTTMRRLKSWRGRQMRQMKQQSFNFRPGKITA